VDVQTKTLMPTSPYYFNVNSVPFEYDPDAPPPKRWLKFLRELWPGDEGKHSRLTLQEMFGLMLRYFSFLKWACNRNFMGPTTAYKSLGVLRLAPENPS
jgi:hypothetical protein